MSWFFSEYHPWNKKSTGTEPVCLDFDVTANLFQTDDKLKEHLEQISIAISKHLSGSEPSPNITATLLPISFGSYFLFIILVFTNCNIYFQQIYMANYFSISFHRLFLLWQIILHQHLKMVFTFKTKTNDLQETVKQGYNKCMYVFT